VSTVTKIDEAHKFWFLYEGTPGGAVDANDQVVRSNGSTTAIGATWSGDIAGDEWAYVADTAKGRSFFLAANENDSFVDSYFLLDNAMTVLGLGRSNSGGTASQLISEENRTFTSVCSATTCARRTTISSTYKPMSVNVGA
jgi:hypothetical protein